MRTILRSAAYALASVAAASVVRLAIDPWLGAQSPLLIYTLGVVAASWHGGRGEGLAATALSAFVGTWLFILPHTGAVIPASERGRIVVFLCVGTAISVVVAKHRNAARALAGKESEIAQTRDRLNEALESTTDSVQLLDREWRIVYMNTRAKQGLPGGETLIGRSIWEAFPGLDETRFGIEYQRAVRENTPVTVTEFFEPLNAWFEVHAYPSPRGLTVYFRDVTDRVRSEQRFESILESISDPFVGLDSEFRYVYINSAAERQLQQSRSELLGKLVFEAFPDMIGTEAEQNYRIAVEKRVPVAFESYYAPWSRWYDIRVSPASDGGISIFFRDITERKEHELALAQSEKRFRSTFENAAVGIAHVANDGKWLRVNARLCEIVGYSRTELLGKAFQDITYPGDVAADEQLFAKLTAGQISSYAMEKRYVHRDGHVIWVLLTTAIERSADGSPLYTISVIQDITERKAAEQALQLMNEDLKRFAYAASHDLQEPLRMVVSFTELLKRKYGSMLDQHALQIIHYAVSGARRMEESLRGLRAYWIASEQRLDPSDSVDAEDALQEALANLQSTVAETSARIESGALPIVAADMPGIVQVFQNLIGNAVKYTRDGVRPHVRISAERFGSQWMFRVADNGVGVPPEFRSQVFGLFKRLHGRERPGTGIGLALCQRIIERRGGAIWVDSSTESGSTFCFTLPAAEPEQAVAS